MAVTPRCFNLPVKPPLPPEDPAIIESTPLKQVFKMVLDDPTCPKFYDEEDDIFKYPLSSTTNTTSSVNEEEVSPTINFKMPEKTSIIEISFVL